MKCLLKYLYISLSYLCKECLWSYVLTCAEEVLSPGNLVYVGGGGETIFSYLTVIEFDKSSRLYWNASHCEWTLGVLLRDGDGAVFSWKRLGNIWSNVSRGFVIILVNDREGRAEYLSWDSVVVLIYIQGLREISVTACLSLPLLKAKIHRFM